MELKGKKILFLGDSITKGVGASSPENRYTDVFARNTGAVIYNYGMSGTRIARQIHPQPNCSIDVDDFNTRVDKMNDEADAVVVFGATNDFGHGDAPFGKFTDRSVFSFYGALHTLILSLFDRYPTARIIFMTPLHRSSEYSYNDSPYHKMPLSEYARAIREVCEYYSVPVLDLYKNSGITTAVKRVKELYIPDGLHPSDLGARRIAEMLEGFMRAL